MPKKKNSKTKYKDISDLLKVNLDTIKGYYSKVFILQEEEKKRISRDLHDETGQIVVALGAALNIIETAVKESQNEQVLTKIDETRKLLQNMASKMKAIAFNLRPPSLDILGLSAVFREFFAQCSKSNPYIRIEFEENLKDAKLDEVIEITLYRIGQESIYNIIKHSQAALVKVNLILSENKIQLIIEDNGKGFDIEEYKKQYDGTRIGLRGIKERVDILNGSLIIYSSLHKGTKLSITLPLGLGNQ